MGTVAFDWNTAKIKTVVALPEGRQQMEMTPKEIIANPNRHQFEPIISALCKTVHELVQMNEAQAARIQEMMKGTPQ